MKHTLRASVVLFAFTAAAALAQPSSLTHRYSFATNATDLIGTANGTLQGNAVITNGSLVLDGVNSYLALPANLFTTYSSVTFEAWVTDNGSSQWARIFDFNNGTTAYMFLSLPSGEANLRGAYTTNLAAGEEILQEPGTGRPPVGQESHIVWTTDGTSGLGLLYVNGVPVATNSPMPLTPAAIGATPNDWLGRSAYSGDPYFFGSIDEFRIYNVALASNLVYQDFQAGPNKFFNGPVHFIAQPQNQTVTQGHAVTFSPDVDGTPPYQFQWLRNTQPMASQTNLTLSFFASLADNQATYQLLATNISTNVTFFAVSSNATLSVIADTTPPVLLTAQSAGLSGVALAFSEPLAAAVATNPANYSITGPSGSITVSSATLDLTASIVTLATVPLSSGSNYIVTVNAITDIAGNAIAPNSQASFIATPYTLVDVGSPAIPGAFISTNNQLSLSAAGAGIGGASDQFSFAYQTLTGNFDMQVRLGSLGLSDLWASAGLMARDGLGATNIFAAAMSTPGPSGSFFQYRSIAGGTAAVAGAFPVNYPDTWLRLQRVGNVFTGYASLDGFSWTQLGAVTMSADAALQVGVAVSSHNASQTTAAAFDSQGNTQNTALNTSPLPFEPLGPSSRHTGLVFSEIMYHPSGVSTGSLEFVEIYNSDIVYEDISGYQLAGSISYTFPHGTILPAGGYLVVASDPASLQAYYGITGVMGPYINKLPNSAGTLQLLNDLGSVLLEVDYDTVPPWPIAPDGAGHSLVMRKPSYGENDPRAWGISDVIDGSPGRGDGWGTEPLRPVVINEFMANAQSLSQDAIELFNTGNTPLNVAGCYLTDDPTTNKFQIPANTVIPARGFVSFTQAQFGFIPAPGGGTIYLKNPSLTRVLDCVRYEPQLEGYSFGRYPDGNDQWYRLTTQTFGATNAPPLLSQIVINELMYKPISGLDDDQYVELYNRGSNSVNLGGWSFTSGITFTFPTNAVIGSNGYVVAAANPSRMFTNYPNLNGTNTFGGFSGHLSHHGERVALAMPETQVTTNGTGKVSTNIVAVVVDEVTYGTGGRWGQWADGGGSSLELIDPNSNKRFAPNWADSDETAKAPWTTIQRTDIIDLGQGLTGDAAPNRFEIILQDAGEFLLDNVKVLSNGGTNYIQNPGFESGTSGWLFNGTLETSGLETNLPAFAGAASLHVRDSGGGDTGANRISYDMATMPVSGTNQATLQAQVRWLKGNTNVLMRIRGNWLECAAGLTAPTNCGTPGMPNSRLVPDAGPAISSVTHYPILPAANQPVVVSARLDDPDGISAATLLYRLDPSTTYTSVAMHDDGTGGDARAGDGIWSATIPGQAANTMVAFTIRASDGRNPLAATTSFPANAPATECMVNFGETLATANIGSYRMWLNQSNITYWNNRAKNSDEGLDCTMVYGNWRVIYNAQTEYTGSPFHTPSYNGPLGSFACNYLMFFPDDDLLMGNDKFLVEAQGPTDQSTFNNDASAVGETTAHWLAHKLGIRPDNRRYVLVYMNGQQRGMVYWDYQKPDGDVISEFFPNDSGGVMHKIDDWFEFDDAGSGQSYVTAKLIEYNLNGKKRTERYRWSWEPEAGSPPNDFTNLYALVDALNAPGPQPYINAVLDLVDVRQFMRMWALEHFVGDWDSYGYRRGKNMYMYKPTQGPWQFLLYDIQLDFGKSSDPPTQPIFDQGNTNDPTLGDPLVTRMYNTPVFVREFWEAMAEIVTNWMQPQIYQPLMNARTAALLANGVPVEANTSIQNWIAQRVAFIQPQIPQAAFSLNGPNSIASSSNSVTITGNAPIGVENISVNGVSYPVNWTGVTTWSITVPVSPGNNSLNLSALDVNGNTIPNGTTNVAANFTGGAVSPVGSIVFNEIMHHPSLDGAQYVELFNTQSNAAFDLSNWRIDGLGYTFPVGSVINPQSYLVLAQDRYAYPVAYGVTSNAVFDQFPGTVDPNSQTISLIQTRTNAPDVTVAEVRYEAAAPWPAGALQPGSSLQLIDPTKDNWRVGNWSAVTTNAPAPSPQWVQAVATGTASSSLLYIYLQSAGDVYVDDVQVVAGSVAGVGPNLLTDGGFESGFPGTVWNVSTNLTSSTLSTTIKHSGNASLHVVSTAAGTTESSAIYQTMSPALTANATYTISYWYLQSTNGGPLTIRLSGSGIVDTVSPAPPTMSPPSIATPGFSNSDAATLPAFAPLWINELQADNITGITNSAGQHAPWLELYNPTTNTVSLNGLYLANNYTNLTNWAFPSTATINPGQFEIIFADGRTDLSTASELHTSFALSSGSGDLALSRIYNGAAQVLDYITYSNVTPNHSYGSFPDGQSFARQEFAFVTPGQTNNGATPPLSVVINEWMAGNTHTLKDPLDGNKFDDWFELYNYGGTTVALDGFFLANSLSTPTQFPIPSGYTIAPHGFLLVWADKKTATDLTAIHTNFKLSKSGTSIALFAPDGTMVDGVTFGAQSSDISEGRYPDGSAFIYFMTSATPAAANIFANTAPSLSAITNRTITLGQTISFTAAATDPDVPPQSLSYALAGIPPAGASINPATGQFAWTPTTIITSNLVTMLVSDDGTPPLSAMQSFYVTVVAPPQLGASALAVNGGQFTLNWPTVPGTQYQLEYKNNLGDPVWTPLGSPFLGTGGVVQSTNSLTPTNTFFRLQILP